MIVHKNNKVDKNGGREIIKKLAKSERISKIQLSLKASKILLDIKNQ